MIFAQLFGVFLRIGLFGFGGGYAMLSLMHSDIVVAHAWLSAKEFTDIVAISQMTPGPIGINAATYVGFTAVQNAGYGTALALLGAITTTTALVLPSFVLMLIVSRFFLKHRNHPMVEAVLHGLRPVIVGLVAAAALLLMNRENFSSWGDDPFAFVASIGIFAVTFVAVWRFKVRPIPLLAVMGALGWLLF